MPRVMSFWGVVSLSHLTKYVSVGVAREGALAKQDVHESAHSQVDLLPGAARRLVQTPPIWCHGRDFLRCREPVVEQGYTCIRCQSCPHSYHPCRRGLGGLVTQIWNFLELNLRFLRFTN
jgi:hypothetical protein